jgi:hypothetical protein
VTVERVQSHARALASHPSNLPKGENFLLSICPFSPQKKKKEGSKLSQNKAIFRVLALTLEVSKLFLKGPDISI